MNAAADRLDDSFPHGTVDGYRRGCRGGVCPAGEEHGLSCRRANQLNAGDYRFQKLVKAGLTPAAIADELGLIPETNATPTPASSKAPPVARTKTAGQAEADETEEPAATEPPTKVSDRLAPNRPAAALAAARDRKAGRAVETREKRATVREWARRNGFHHVPTRGSIRSEIVYAFVDAGGKDLPRAATPTPPPAAPATAPTPPADVEPETEQGEGSEADAPAALAPGGIVSVQGLVEIDAFATAESAAEAYIPLSTTATSTRSQEVIEKFLAGGGMTIPTEIVPDDTTAPTERPQWGDVAAAEDVERARSLAAHLEAENAILVAQVDLLGRSLEFALQQWAIASDRITAAEHRRIGAVRVLLATNRRLAVNNDELLTKNADLAADFDAATTNALALAAQLEQANAARAVAEAAVAKPRRFFGGAR